MANKIQIKRSVANATVTGLANGELAYTGNNGVAASGGVLYVGDPAGGGSSIAIGGQRFPGTLTANQALVANATFGIDKVLAANVAAIDNVFVGANVIANTTAYFVGNTTVNTFITQNLLDLGGGINANGGIGTAGQVLTSGAAGNVYWSSITGATNLTDSANATTVTVLSDTGTDAVLESANATAAGILTSADWTKLNNMPANSVAGSNSQVMFNANGVLAGDDGFTYNGVSNTLTVQNISVSGTATLNIDSISVGNSTVNTSLVPTLIQAANSTGTSNLTPTTLTIGTSVVNSSAVAAGSNAYVNTTALFISSNSTVNATATATLLQVSNSTSTSNLTATQLNIGANVFANTSAFDVGNTIITSALLTLGGQVNANGGVGSAGQVLTSGAAGNAYWTTPAAGVAGSNSQVQFNANGVLSGDAGFVFDGVADALIVGGAAQTTSPTFRVANSTTSANLSSASLTIGTAVVNSSAVAAGTNSYMNVTSVFISTNSTINATMTAGGLQVSNSTSTANVTAAGFRILDTIANTTGLFVGANVFANSSAFDVGNTIITTTNLTLGGQVTANGGAGSAGQVLTSGAAGNAYWTTPTTGTVTSVTGGNGLTGSITTTGSLDVGAGNGISVGTDAVSVNGGSTLTVNSTGVHVNSTLSITDLILSGNLDINGTLTTVDTTNLSVTDSIISLARGQSTANTLDIGFYGTFGNATVTSYSGLFRDATDSKYRLFTGAIPEPTTTVDTANVNYAGATLVVQALEGANSTATIDSFIIDGGTF